MRTNQAELDSLVRQLTDRLGRPEYGWYRFGQDLQENRCYVGALTLDRGSGGSRLHEVISASGGMREVSPRLPASQMADFLRAMLTGLDFAEASMGGYGSIPRWDSVMVLDHRTKNPEPDDPPGWDGAGSDTVYGDLELPRG